jgi:3-methyladenine DNA glycosylase AlkD
MDASKYVKDQISKKENKEKAEWLQNYIKHDLKSKGVGIPDIRQIVKEATVKFSLNKQSQEYQLEVLNDLMQSSFTEDKLAAIIYLQLNWKTVGVEATLAAVESWFDNNWINDWNVCDWLCVRILTPVLDVKPDEAVTAFKSWYTSENLWKARASLVPFAQSKTIKNYTDLIYQLSSALIKREERFCKTSVGWVLRECSKFNSPFVDDFLQVHKEWMTPEVIKNAKKYKTSNLRNTSFS